MESNGTIKKNKQNIKTHSRAITPIARSHNASFATRKVSDFEECGIDIIIPWK